MTDNIGHWAFLVAVALALLAGLVPTLQEQPWLVWTLALLGLIIGLLNVTIKETTGFLVATISLMISATVLAPLLPPIVKHVLNNIIAVTSPAALVLSIKTVWDMAKD